MEGSTLHNAFLLHGSLHLWTFPTLLLCKVAEPVRHPLQGHAASCIVLLLGSLRSKLLPGHIKRLGSHLLAALCQPARHLDKVLAKLLIQGLLLAGSTPGTTTCADQGKPWCVPLE